MDNYRVHELTMIHPTCGCIYTPSRLRKSYELPLDVLRQFNIIQMDVSLDPDGFSNARRINVLSGPVTGLPYLMVYKPDEQIPLNATQLLIDGEK